MTKVATIENHRFLAVVLIIAMLAAMIPVAVAVFPGGVLAGDNSTDSSHITTYFTTGDIAPVVNGITVTDNSNNAATTLSPQVEYKIKVDITDNNTLADVASIRVYFYYDADGSYVQPSSFVADNQTFAVLNWDNVTGGTFTLDAGHGTTSSWSLHGVTPTLSANNGVFEFHVTPSKVAKYSAAGGDNAQWHIYAVATDIAAATGSNYLTGLEMNWYGEIASVTASVDWGSVALGSTTQSTVVNASYYSNGNFSEQVCATTPWTHGSDSVALNTAGTPGSGEFSLKADDTNVVGTAIQVTGSYQDIDATGTITAETGHVVGSNYVWLTLGSTGIPVGQYTGIVYFKINQRS